MVVLGIYIVMVMAQVALNSNLKTFIHPIGSAVGESISYGQTKINFCIMDKEQFLLNRRA